MQGGQPTYGIILTATIASGTASIVAYQSPNGATGWFAVGSLLSGGTLTLNFSNDGVVRYWKCRTEQVGYDPGAYSSVLNHAPYQLGQF